MRGDQGHDRGGGFRLVLSRFRRRALQSGCACARPPAPARGIGRRRDSQGLDGHVSCSEEQVLTRGEVTWLVGRMEAAGLVERAADPGDRRARHRWPASSAAADSPSACTVSRADGGCSTRPMTLGAFCFGDPMLAALTCQTLQPVLLRAVEAVQPAADRLGAAPQLIRDHPDAIRVRHGDTVKEAAF
ncbi:helix-turn-helix domain-containing protein [Streptomyces sp. NPDC004542]|uniref:helix-turn-helix domain-containing protein n=1 Tax=Streptomyces sp. NPDC004542 TaxID=3154281 RepID=UPI0033B95495